MGCTKGEKLIAQNMMTCHIVVYEHRYFLHIVIRNALNEILNQIEQVILVDVTRFTDSSMITYLNYSGSSGLSRKT